jgi:hypothetical protein
MRILRQPLTLERCGMIWLRATRLMKDDSAGFSTSTLT